MLDMDWILNPEKPNYSGCIFEVYALQIFLSNMEKTLYVLELFLEKINILLQHFHFVKI